jgi:hypothetical protein
MIFGYNKTTKEITTYDETDLKSHGIFERKDLEKWIEDYPDILGEEVFIITTEYDKFDKTNERLDLLALDKNGELVVIEMKRDDSGKYADLQAIKYAAYCSTLTFNDVVKLYQSYKKKFGIEITEDEAKKEIHDFIDNEDFEELSGNPRIILVSKEFRSEVTASVLWLRKFGVDITCVKLTPYKLDEHNIVFESTILIPLPEAKDFVIQVERKESAERGLTITQEEYLKFYTELVKKLNSLLPRDYPKPMPRYYYSIPIGINNVHFEWAFHGQPRSSFGVELHFERDQEFNRFAIEQLEKFVPKLEEATKEKVIVQKESSKFRSRLYIEKNEGRMTEELKDWAVRNMKIFIDILEPEVKKLMKRTQSI